MGSKQTFVFLFVHLSVSLSVLMYVCLFVCMSVSLIEICLFVFKFLGDLALFVGLFERVLVFLSSKIIVLQPQKLSIFSHLRLLYYGRK
jgi:hypothetical protein